ncbi:MAG: Bacterial regulatory protein luxR family [Planctomycetota bacterium]|jgi:DNA-binding CsgD family transcriptional regulator
MKPARGISQTGKTSRSRRSSEAPLSIATAGILEAVSHPINLQVWESIRRFRRAVSTSEVQVSSRVPLAQVQAAIDALHRARLVELVPATRENRTIRWKTTHEQLLITYRRDIIEEELLQQNMQQLFDQTHRDLRAKVKPRAARTRGDFHWNSIDAAQLTVPEVNEVYELLQRVITVVRRAKERVAGLGPEAQVDSNYMLSIDVEPLIEGVLPLPTMQCIGSTAEIAPALSQETDAEAVLTARERDVALRLAAGASRTDVSRELGISPHTVTEFTRRIYRKLGVNNRARLAAKLASGT